MSLRTPLKGLHMVPPYTHPRPVSACLGKRARSLCGESGAAQTEDEGVWRQAPSASAWSRRGRPPRRVVAETAALGQDHPRRARCDAALGGGGRGRDRLVPERDHRQGDRSSTRMIRRRAAGLVQMIPTSDAPISLLLVGSDHRGKAVNGQFGLSDTLMLMRIDPKHHMAALFSIPRDLWVSGGRVRPRQDQRRLLAGRRRARAESGQGSDRRAPQLPLERRLLGLPRDRQLARRRVRERRSVLLQPARHRALLGLVGDRHQARLPAAQRTRRAGLLALSPHR